MCEPWIVAKTGLTVLEHQARTVDNFLQLRAELGGLVIPVIQGYGPRDYDRCIGRYQDNGVDLAAEPVVGLGSCGAVARSGRINYGQSFDRGKFHFHGQRVR